MIEVFKFWVRYWYEEYKEWKNHKLGDSQGIQGDIKARSKQLSLGMPRKASPLSSLTLSVTLLWAIFLFITWYVFCLEYHFSLVRIFLMLFRIMFCIFIFNKEVKDSLYHAYFVSIHVAVSKQKVYRCCKNSLEKSEHDIVLKLFA